jgi:hypothetical protein
VPISRNSFCDGGRRVVTRRPAAFYVDLKPSVEGSRLGAPDPSWSGTDATMPEDADMTHSAG